MRRGPQLRRRRLLLGAVHLILRLLFSPGALLDFTPPAASACPDYDPASHFILSPRWARAHASPSGFWRLQGEQALALVASLLAGQAAAQEPYCIIDTATAASQAPPLPLPFYPTAAAAAPAPLCCLRSAGVLCHLHT